LASTHVAERNLQKYPNNYILLRYETLASAPEETLQKVCDFIGEEYSPQMLGMDAVPEMKERGGNSSYGTFEPAAISTRSIGRYRDVLSDAEIRFIQTIARREMDRYGYESAPIHLSPSGQVSFFMAMLPVNSLRMAGWQALESLRMKKEPIPISKILVDGGQDKDEDKDEDDNE
jgi:hypothetical protein